MPEEDRRDKRLVVYVEQWLFDWLVEQAEKRDETISALPSGCVAAGVFASGYHHRSRMEKRPGLTSR